MKQLWSAASPDFGLVVHGGTKHGGRIPAPELRMMHWPDGRTCWEINSYLIDLRKQGLTTTSVNTYCSELASTVRFLFASRVRITDIADDTLMDLSQWLSNKLRSGNQTNRLISRLLLFLEWFQHLVPDTKLIGVLGEGANVTVKLEPYRSRTSSIRLVMTHASFVPASVPRLVRPMASAVFNSLLQACDKISKTPFVCARNSALLVLLADSGIRREEAVWVRVDDVLNPKKPGALEVRTSKSHGNPLREVPIPDVTLRALKAYIEVPRAIRLRQLRKRYDREDAGWLLCAQNGEQMAAATVSQIFVDLRQMAGISERATAHMLRHRWITLQLIFRLKRLQRRGIIAAEALVTILSRLASISGHGSVDSLWTYVDFAYEELLHESTEEYVPAALVEARKVASDLVRNLSARGSNKLDVRHLTRLDVLLAEVEELARYPVAAQSVAAHSLARHAEWN